MFDHSAAHKHFAADAFNAAWDLILKPDRTLSKTREVIRLAETSYHHWLHVPDHTPQNLSISNWQLARVYTLAHEPATALHYANECLRLSQEAELSPFYLGHAHEALARAAALAGDAATSASHLAQAQSLLSEISGDHDRKALATDLRTISLTSNLPTPNSQLLTPNS